MLDKLKSINQTQVRAIVAGIGMAAGLQLSGDLGADVVIIILFIAGGITDLVHSFRRPQSDAGAAQ